LAARNAAAPIKNEQCRTIGIKFTKYTR